jgi:nitrate/nitrite-specific signal transduction histidine kinase
VIVRDEHAHAGSVATVIAPEVMTGLGAVSRVSRALVGTGDLPVLAGAALEEMRDALGLELAALYLPDADGQPVLRRHVGDEAAAAELAFDEEAWRLAVAGGAPIVLREPASWLVAHPFHPPAADWLILPLAGPEKELAGVVVASAGEPISLDPLHRTVLTLLGLQLSAGIATARLRQQLRHAEMERERRQLAAEVHDGLAQHLALALRELALLDSDAGSRERLQESLTAAHRLVRARLQELTTPLGGLRQAVEAAAERARRRGLAVRVIGHADAPGPEVVTLVSRVASEALANVDSHADARAVEVRLQEEDGRLELTVADDGRGFDVAQAPGVAQGHLGLTVMRERARSYGGDCCIESRPGVGTRVTLWVPL